MKNEYFRNMQAFKNITLMKHKSRFDTVVNYAFLIKTDFVSENDPL